MVGITNTRSGSPAGEASAMADAPQELAGRPHKLTHMMPNHRPKDVTMAACIAVNPA
jgi:hypothetical protein